MAGSLRLVKGRSDTWELRVYVGRDSVGRVRHKHARFRGSRRQAERELARLVAEQESAPAAIPEEPTAWGPTTTVNDAIAAWRDNGWDDLSPKTALRYESVWEVHIRRTIGRQRIASLGPYEVERYFRELKGKGLSEGSVRMVRAVLHRACRLARRWSGNVLPNPIGDTELPTWRLDERAEKVRAPELGEIVKLLSAAKAGDIRILVFIRVLAATGVRRGEACALRWCDIDMTAGTLRVDEAIVAAKGGAVVRSPKTRASIRTVAVDAGTLEVIEQLRREQERVAAACGQSMTDDGFVFSFEPGGLVPPYPDSFSHALSRLRTKSGVASDVHLHSLRHFHATVLDPVVSEAQKQARLGWSTVQMARHYTDGVPEEDRRAAEHVGALLG
jgi:integrase